MVEITKENINNAILKDKQWRNPKKSGFIKRISTGAKIIMYLFGAVAIFTIANLTLVYSFYKILIKL